MSVASSYHESPVSFWKSLFLALILSLPVSLYANGVGSEEVTLFNSDGEATAYIADDLTIYLFSGEPVAYLHEDRGDEYHVYGFNGNHLGWYVDGVVRDHDGNAVGADKEAYPGYTRYEPYKSYKAYSPYKAYREYAPHRPYFTRSWSSVELETFLREGRD